MTATTTKPTHRQCGARLAEVLAGIPDEIDLFHAEVDFVRRLLPFIKLYCETLDDLNAVGHFLGLDEPVFSDKTYGVAGRLVTRVSGEGTALIPIEALTYVADTKR